MLRFASKAGEAVLLASLLASVMAGCSPEPGTPEYVLQKMKQGNAVGGENLGLLGPDRVPVLRALLDDRTSPRMARMQALERLCQLNGPGEETALASFLDDPDPEVRIRIARFLSERRAPEVVSLLLGRLGREQEELVRTTLARALQAAGKAMETPPEGTVEGFAAGLAADKGSRRADWLLALGGFHGEDVERILIASLEDQDPVVAATAARSLRGPAVRSIERMGPIYVGLLASPRLAIRQAGLAALEAASHPNRVPGPTACAEKPVLKLVEAVPEISQAIQVMLRDTNMSGRDRKLAESLRDCLAKFAPDAADGGA
jgi:hypothetical protein